MKKIIFSAVSALALASFAADSTQFGVMKVPSSAANTIVSVPWLESSTEDSDVSISNLVLTSGLNVGDQLLYYKGDSSYDSWVLAEDSTTKVRYWTPGNNVTLEGIEISAASDAQTIARGDAIVLKRNNPGDCFYIMGKPFTGTEQSVALSGGTYSSPVYSLIAPPAVSNVDINANMEWKNITKYDSIIMPDGTSLVWNNTSKVWKKRVGNQWTADGITIPLGTGVWFIGKSEGGEDGKSFKLK